MFNFGPVAVPIVFLLLDIFIARSRKWIYSLAAIDIRAAAGPLVDIGLLYVISCRFR